MPENGAKTILLVEDNPNDVELTRIAFENNDIKIPIQVVGDGVEALDYLLCTGKYSDRDIRYMPQLVILDLKMPKVGGLEVLERIRAHETVKFVPVVILTSSREEQDMLKAYQLGVNAYVHKPIDFNQFVQAVRSMANFWLELNEFPHMFL